MKQLSALKYLTIVTLPIMVAISFEQRGWLTYLPVLYIFGLVPLLEIVIGKSSFNLDQDQESKEKNNPLYSWVIYLMVPVQYSFLLYFCFGMANEDLSNAEITGRILSFGLMCGTLGINVAHELGHRPTVKEQRMAKALLLTSLYTHFFIEHNRGHHKNVATANDPASARLWEPVFFFWVRSIIGSYLSAWRLEVVRLQKHQIRFWSLQNEMLVFQLLHLALLAAIATVFGWQVMVYFVAAALVGILLLETVNYIEHYGLMRTLKERGNYERVMPWHSWNSDHLIGRLLLFELSRHSDHHFIASRHYQILRHHDQSPQLPTGYPGMMLMALVPPVWYVVMHPRVKKAQQMANNYVK